MKRKKKKTRKRKKSQCLALSCSLQNSIFQSQQSSHLAPQFLFGDSAERRASEQVRELVVRERLEAAVCRRWGLRGKMLSSVSSVSLPLSTATALIRRRQKKRRRRSRRGPSDKARTGAATSWSKCKCSRHGERGRTAIRRTRKAHGQVHRNFGLSRVFSCVFFSPSLFSLGVGRRRSRSTSLFFFFCKRSQSPPRARACSK